MPNSNKILGDIVIISGGTVTDPSNRNKLLQDWLGALTISRFFTPMYSALAQYYSVNSLITLESGDTFSQRFLAPTAIVTNDETICDGDDGVNRGLFELDTDGTYNLTANGTVTVDGVAVTGASNYPTDGKQHQYEITATGTLKIKFWGIDNTLTNGYNGILSDSKATISSAVEVWPLDQTGAFEDTSLTYNNFAASDPKLFDLNFDGNWSGKENFWILGTITAPIAENIVLPNSGLIEYNPNFSDVNITILGGVPNHTMPAGTGVYVQPSDGGVAIVTSELSAGTNLTVKQFIEVA